MRLKSRIRAAIQRFGWDIHKIQPEADPFSDMRVLLEPKKDPIIFDVGANVGRSIRSFQSTFPNPVIHAFEPSPVAFSVLQSSSGLGDVHLNNVGVGSRSDVLEFLDRSDTEHSSFLGDGEDAARALSEICQRIPVEVVTLDAYCGKQGIHGINVLKCDAQGFDLEVLKGAGGLFAGQQIDCVFIELQFIRPYEKAGTPGQIIDFLIDNGMTLMRFYGTYYLDDIVSWTDALFVRREVVNTGNTSRARRKTTCEPGSSISETNGPPERPAI